MVLLLLTSLGGELTDEAWRERGSLPAEALLARMEQEPQLAESTHKPFRTWLGKLSAVYERLKGELLSQSERGDTLLATQSLLALSAVGASDSSVPSSSSDVLLVPAPHPLLLSSARSSPMPAWDDAVDGDGVADLSDDVEDAVSTEMTKFVIMAGFQLPRLFPFVSRLSVEIESASSVDIFECLALHAQELAVADSNRVWSLPHDAQLVYVYNTDDAGTKSTFIALTPSNTKSVVSAARRRTGTREVRLMLHIWGTSKYSKESHIPLSYQSDNDSDSEAAVADVPAADSFDAAPTTRSVVVRSEAAEEGAGEDAPVGSVWVDGELDSAVLQVLCCPDMVMQLLETTFRVPAQARRLGSLKGIDDYIDMWRTVLHYFSTCQAANRMRQVVTSRDWPVWHMLTASAAREIAFRLHRVQDGDRLSAATVHAVRKTESEIQRTLSKRMSLGHSASAGVASQTATTSVQREQPLLVHAQARMAEVVEHQAAMRSIADRVHGLRSIWTTAIQRACQGRRTSLAPTAPTSSGGLAVVQLGEWTALLRIDWWRPVAVPIAAVAEGRLPSSAACAPSPRVCVANPLATGAGVRWRGCVVWCLRCVRAAWMMSMR